MTSISCCSFIKLADPASEYGVEAIDRFRSLCEGRKLVANIDNRDGPLIHLRLMDTSNATTTDDSLGWVNVDLVREGLATVDRSCKYIQHYPEILQKLKAASALAKRERLGMFEFGDVEEDEE